MPEPATELRQIETKRRQELKELFAGRGYYEELKQAINHNDSSWIATLAQKQFAQLYDPVKQAKFLCDFARLFPDIAAKDAWFNELRPLIAIMKGNSQRDIETPLRQHLNPGAAPKSKRGRPQDKMARNRQEVIRKVAQKGHKGEEYCDMLGKAGLSTSIAWQKNERCPKNYLDAFNHADPTLRKKWRDRIADEKYRATRKKPLV
jgi:hypothetical protein